MSERALGLFSQTNIRGQIIVELENFKDDIFGMVEIEKLARIGEDDLTIGEFIIGGRVRTKKSRALISPQGTTSQLSQQIIPDTGLGSSVQTLKIRLIDRDDILTGLFSRGRVVPDIRGEKGNIYIAPQGGTHPEDSIRVLIGTVRDYKFGAGFVELTFAHSEELKRTDIFPIQTTELTGGVSDSDLSFPVVSTAGFLAEEDVLQTYLKIGEEIVRYTEKSPNEFTIIERGVAGTVAQAHNEGDTVESIYRLEGETLELVKKIMASGERKFYRENIEVDSFNLATPNLTIPNSIILKTISASRDLNVQIGDKVTIQGDDTNNVEAVEILGFGDFDGGTFITIDHDLVEKFETPATFSLESKYRTMTQRRTGCSIPNDMIDFERFDFWENLFGSQYPRHAIWITEPFTAKDFIEKELLHPPGLYSVPRKGRISVQMTVPPINQDEVITLDLSNVINPDKLSLENSTAKFFYNTIEFKYNFEIKSGNFLVRSLRVSEDSLSRIERGFKKLSIESKGLRREFGADATTFNAARRLLFRYRFGAQSLSGVRLTPSVGFRLEIGDQVFVDGASLKLSDVERGDRAFRPKLFEVINKTWNVITGAVTVDLLDTGFGLDFRSGLVGPASFLALGSTERRIRLKKSFTTQNSELDKWLGYVGQVVRIRSEDYSFDEERRFVEIDPTRNDTIILDEPLSIAPPEGYILQQPKYDGENKGKFKAINVFRTPVVPVAEGVSNEEFIVSGDDIGKFFVGGFVQVNSPDFTRRSPRLEIVDIVGNNVIISNPDQLVEGLGFVPEEGDEVRAIGFSSDNGLPYNYL